MTAESVETTIWRNARLATFAKGAPGLGVVERGAIVAARRTHRLRRPRAGRAGAPCGARSIDCEGRWITPGPDRLPHPSRLRRQPRRGVRGASRRRELRGDRARRAAASSRPSARRAAASEDELVRQALPRLDALIAEGVTTVEIKSGYGLDLEDGAQDAARRAPPRRRASGRGPRDLSRRACAAARVCERPRGLCRRGRGRDAAGARRRGPRRRRRRLLRGHRLLARGDSPRVPAARKRLGLPVKLHAEQLSNSGGAALAAEFGALSAEHLEYADEARRRGDGAARASSRRSLPGAFYTLRETKAPPIELFRRHGVPMAVSTDCNPGTSPMTSLLLAMNMAATLFRLTVEECLAGVTRNAARALGLAAETGSLETGKWADLAIWDIERPAELVYRLGFNPLHARVWRGR